MSTPSIAPDSPGSLPEKVESVPVAEAEPSPLPAPAVTETPAPAPVIQVEPEDRLERYLKGPTAFCA